MSSRYSPSPDDRRRDNRRSPPRYRRSPPPQRRSRRGSSKDKESGCLFVGNIPYTFREEEIRDLFGKFGEIENVTVGMNHTTQQPKGHVFVQFRDPRDAQDVHQEFQGKEIEGRSLHIDFDAGRKNKMKMRESRRPYDRPSHHGRSRSPRRRSPRGHSPRRFSRGGHGNRSPHGDRGNRSPRGGHGNRSPHGDRGNRSPHGDRGNRSPRGDRGNRSPRGDHANRSPRGDRGNRSPHGDRSPRMGSPPVQRSSPPKSSPNRNISSPAPLQGGRRTADHM